jgi:acetyl-CoA synthetase
MIGQPRSAGLARLLRPRHIAVFGGRFAAEVIRQSERIGFTGDIWPVNPGRSELGGRQCFTDVAALPEAPDASFIAVPREATIEIVGALAARGAGGAVCYASGFAEADDEGRTLHKALLEAAGELGIVGPNCYGLLNYLDGAALWPDKHGGVRVEEGVAIVTQSGNVGISLTMQQRSLPLAYLISVGNQAVLNIADYIEALIVDARVKAIGLHVESVDDVEHFCRAALAARDRRVPLVVLKVGRSELGALAALSHTSSLVGGDTLYDALFERMHIARVETLTELLETLKLLAVSGPLPGRRMVSISCSGGEAALVADSADTLGMQMPDFNAKQTRRLRAVLGTMVHVANPLDYHTFIWGNPQAQRECFAAVLGGGQDITLKVLDYVHPALGDSRDWDRTIDAFIDAARDAPSCTAVISTLPENLPQAVREKLMAHGITPLQGLQEGMHAVKAAMDIGEWYARTEPPLAVEVGARITGEIKTVDEWLVKLSLKRYGIRVPEGRQAHSGTIREAAAGVSYPVVLKAVDNSLVHKSDAGAVILNIRDAAALVRAADAMAPEYCIFLIEPMVSGAVAELLIGVVRDPQFGLSLTIGAGGTLVELSGDARTLLFPVTEQSVAKALDGLKVSKLLDGYRGRPRGDRRAAIDAIMAAADWAVGHSTFVELEINPLLVLPEGQGAVAVDALMRIERESDDWMMQ